MICLPMVSLDLVESSAQSQIDLIQRWNCLMKGKLGLLKVDVQCLSLKKMLSLRLILVLSSLTGLKVDMILGKLMKMI